MIAGWDVGILGDAEQGIPPMKVTSSQKSLDHLIKFIWQMLFTS